MLVVVLVVELQVFPLHQAVAVLVAVLALLEALLLLTLVAGAVAVEILLLLQGHLETAALASSFSNGPSPYRPQIPLHLPVHG
jgi:hypothetical protein